MVHEYVDQVVHKGKRPSLRKEWPADLQELLHDCWLVEGNKRPTIQRVRCVIQKCIDVSDPRDGTD